MKKENTALKTIGRFFASTLSPILIALIVGSAIFTSVRSMLTVKSVTNILKAIPYEEIIEPESFENMLSDIAEKSGDKVNVTSDSISSTVKDVLDSEPVLEIVELYAKDAASIMTGEFTTANISSEKIKEIFTEHSDEIVKILTDNYPELDKAEVEDAVDTVIDENLGGFIDQLPELDELNNELEDFEEVKILGVFFTDMILYIIWGAVAVIALLIFVCRLYHFKGLKWIGIDAVVASAILIAAALGLSSDKVTEFVDIDFITSIMTGFASKVNAFGIIVGVVGVLFIAAGIVLHYVYRNKAKREQERLAQAQIQTEAAQSEVIKTEQTQTEEDVASEQVQAEDK